MLDSFLGMFVLKLLEMVASHAECSKLEQRSVIKILVAEKCKPYEICRRKYEEYREAYFSQEKWLQMGTAWVYHYELYSKKRVHRVEAHWLSGKEKVSCATISKEGHVDSVLEHEKSHHYWFSLKISLALDRNTWNHTTGANYFCK